MAYPRKKEKEEVREESNKNYYDGYSNASSSSMSRRGYKSNNDNAEEGYIANSNEEILGADYTKFYEQYLYDLLPAIYQAYDKKENGALEEFLKIIAGQAAAIRQDIDGLLNNFFINSCDEWVIPYIADLIAAKVFPNSSMNSRIEVQNTIRWRKLKGTLVGLEDSIRNSINRNAKVKEAFKFCSSSSHLAFGGSDVIVNKPQNFVNLHDQDALSGIDTENDTLPHMIDVRDPTQTSGWHNIKNLLIFVPQLKVYHVDRVHVEGEDDQQRFYFSNLVRKKQMQPSLSSSSPSSSSKISNFFPLYDLDQGVKITDTSFAQNPFKYFGKRRGMSVKIDNIMAACTSASTFSPSKQEGNVRLDKRVTIATASSSPLAESNRGNNYNDPSQDGYDTDDSGSNIDDNNKIPDFISFHKTEGVRILEPRKFSGQDKGFIIRLYSYSKETGPTELANYNTLRMSYHLLARSKPKKRVSGTILLSIELDSDLNEATEFPETVIAIRDSLDIRIADRIESKYRNALYVYLPSILVDRNERKYFFADRDGSTYEVQMIDGKYDYDIESAELEGPRTNKNLRKRIAPSNQVFPPRQLTYSMQPLRGFTDLNRFKGIKAVDAKKYEKESFVIEAIAINYDKEQAWKIGKLQARGGVLQYINENEVWIKWTMILDAPNNNYPPYPLPASHFKTTRLNIKNNFEDIHVSTCKIVESVLPKEIVSEYALDTTVGTFSIDSYRKEEGKDDSKNENKPNPNNTDEYEVKIKIRPEYHEYFEYLGNKIRNSIENKPEFVHEGKLMLRISKNTPGDFPQSEVILTNSSSRSVLVYLPQLTFDRKEKTKNVYVTDDGSTSHEKELLKPARKSAGQTIPIPNKYPLQQRIPVYVNLANWQAVSPRTVHFGEVAIDPEHGRFAFSKEDKLDVGYSNELGGALVRVTAHYNYAFSQDVGAGAYDKRDSLKKNKATKWISKDGHTPHSDAFPSKTFQSVADAFASAKNGDVLQIEDNGIYDEDLNNNYITLPPDVRDVTLQAANWAMPVIRSRDQLKLEFKDALKQINLNGILITGGPLTLNGKFDKLSLTSCTIDPGFGEDKSFLDDHKEKSFSGIRIEEHSEVRKKERGHNDNQDATSVTNSNEHDIQRRPTSTSFKEIFLFNSICGGIIVDDSVSLINLEDSIVHNTGGPAISFNENNNKEGNSSILKLEAKRSNILSEYPDDYVLDLEDICCINCMLTNRVRVKTIQKQKILTDNDNNCGTSLRCCRYEQSLMDENTGKDNNIAIVNCTTDKPIFISTTFGHPAYLHLGHLNSKSILEGAENKLEMGAFNKSYRPLSTRNLNLRLHEFLPLGIKSGVIYTY